MNICLGFLKLFIVQDEQLVTARAWERVRTKTATNLDNTQNVITAVLFVPFVRTAGGST
jgi:hypothetical protein